MRSGGRRGTGDSEDSASLGQVPINKSDGGVLLDDWVLEGEMCKDHADVNGGRPGDPG